jgi:hypothetical protein
MPRSAVSHRRGSSQPGTSSTKSGRTSKRSLQSSNDDYNDTPPKSRKLDTGNAYVPNASSDVPNSVLNNKLDALLRGQEMDRGRLKRLEENEVRYDKQFSDLNNRVNSIEQSALNARIEVSGLDFDLNGDRKCLRDKFVDYAKNANLGVHTNDVMDVFAIRRPYNGGQRSFLIVIFSHEAIKNRVMRQKILSDKGKKTTVYFSHVLTSQNRAIFMEARKLVKERKIFKTWTMGGNVYIVKEEGDYKMKMESIEQLAYAADYVHNHSHASGTINSRQRMSIDEEPNTIDMEQEAE